MVLVGECYSTSTITHANFSSHPSFGVGAPAQAGQVQEVHVDGLSASTYYNFAMKWKDSTGTWSPMSVVPHGTTLSSGTSCNYQTTCTWDGVIYRGEIPETADSPLAFAPPSPNPAAGNCLFRYSIPAELEGQEVDLAIFDVSGRRRATIQDLSAAVGSHEARWELRDADGRRIGPGVYYARLRIGSQLLRRTLVVAP